jgi:hypothetical protein
MERKRPMVKDFSLYLRVGLLPFTSVNQYTKLCHIKEN